MEKLQRIVDLASDITGPDHTEQISELLSDYTTEGIGHVLINFFGELCLRDMDKAHALLHVLYNNFHPKFPISIREPN